jgi:hypothetical protein
VESVLVYDCGVVWEKIEALNASRRDVTCYVSKAGGLKTRIRITQKQIAGLQLMPSGTSWSPGCQDESSRISRTFLVIGSMVITLPAFET